MMHTLPQPRIRGVRPSPIRTISEGAPPGSVPLGLGEPTWPTLHPALELQAAIQASPCAYGPNAGLESLRLQLGLKYDLNVDCISVTTGAQGALFSLFHSYLSPGDQVLVPDPGFPGYGMLANMMQCQTVAYPLTIDAEQHYQLDPAQVEQALLQAERPKILMLNHPSNPTSATAEPGDLLAVVRLAEKFGVLVISDEVYRDLSPRPVGIEGLPSQNLVRISSLSKAWAGAGLRVGWMLGQPEILTPARTIHSGMVTAASRNNQQTALWLLQHSDEVIAHSLAQLDERWAALEAACRQEWGWVPTRPNAGFYLWLPLPNGESDSLTFCLDIRDRCHVILVPGRVFGSLGEGFVRLSFAAEPELLREGINRLAPVWGRT